jgi:CheY-like chemotaxis protein
MALEKILVIEDNPKHMADAKEYFQDKPVEVVYASNMQEARAAYRDVNAAMKAQQELSEQYKRGEISKEEFEARDDEFFERPYLAGVDGIITDIYFPLTDSAPWDQPEPIGVRVAVEAGQMNIPFVMNTAGYHHGAKYEWINQFAQEQDWPLVDAAKQDGAEAPVKKWDEAYKWLEAKYEQ